MLETLFILSGIALTMALFLDFPKDIVTEYVMTFFTVERESRQPDKAPLLKRAVIILFNRFR